MGLLDRADRFGRVGGVLEVLDRLARDHALVDRAENAIGELKRDQRGFFPKRYEQSK